MSCSVHPHLLHNFFHLSLNLFVTILTKKQGFQTTSSKEENLSRQDGDDEDESE